MIGRLLCALRRHAYYRVSTSFGDTITDVCCRNDCGSKRVRSARVIQRRKFR